MDRSIFNDAQNAALIDLAGIAQMPSEDPVNGYQRQDVQRAFKWSSEVP